MKKKITNDEMYELYSSLEKRKTTSIFLIPLSILLGTVLIAGALIFNSVQSRNTLSSNSATIASSSNNSISNSVTGSILTNVDLSHSVIQGNQNAKVGIVEFSDYQCPYCKQVIENVWPTIISQYINTGKVERYFKDFPLTQIHPLAMIGAQAARCAGNQDKYWQMHDAIYSGNQDTNDQTSLDSYAQKLSLNLSQFDNCISTNEFSSEIQTDITQGNNLGVQGTPTIIIGKISSDHKTLTGQIIYGAYPLSEYLSVLKQYIK